jgi:hypothetical protein
MSCQSATTRMNGGSGAASHAIAVYGDMGSQQAVSPYDNTIRSQQAGGYKFRMTRRHSRSRRSSRSNSRSRSTRTRSNSNSRSRRSTRSNSSSKGGSGAASHATAVYGAMNDQHAASGSGNLIASQQAGGYRFSRQTSRLSKGKKTRGGTTLTEFAVPAALLFATRFGSRRHRSQKSRKHR